jgi:hypothetical protein
VCISFKKTKQKAGASDLKPKQVQSQIIRPAKIITTMNHMIMQISAPFKNELRATETAW